MLRYRINRATYWLMGAIVITVLAGLSLTGHRFGGAEFMIILLAVPRLHDIGRSGWWAVGVILVEFAAIIGLVTTDVALDTIILLSGIWVMLLAALGVWLGWIPGEAHANRWGEPPAPGIQFRKNAG